MNEVLTANRMRAVERAAIDGGTVSGLELMERAGQGATDAIRARLPHSAAASPEHAIVLCGPGNNGGDGFVVARVLAQTGWNVTVLELAGSPGSPDRQNVAARWAAQGAVQPYGTEALRAAAQLSAGAGTVVVIDALFGIGQRAPMDNVLSPLADLTGGTFGQSDDPAPFFVSLDVPTGYDTDTGELLCARPFPADLTLAFHARKPVHDRLDDMGSEVAIVGIGL